MNNQQKKLSQDQIAAFYHNQFVGSQVDDFIALLGDFPNLLFKKIVDIGGGCGFFAKALHNRTNLNVTVLDSDNQSINFCRQEGVEATCGDALKPPITGDENIVCFNLILHHLVGSSEDETYKMQRQALSVWHSTVQAIFVHEYIYESFFF